MTWPIVILWGLVAGLLFVLIAREPMDGDRMWWAVALCASWPVVLAFFLVGTGLWAIGSAYHAMKRSRK
jgi:hypothetical protein